MQQKLELCSEVSVQTLNHVRSARPLANRAWSWPHSRLRQCVQTLNKSDCSLSQAMFPFWKFSKVDRLIDRPMITQVRIKSSHSDHTWSPPLIRSRRCDQALNGRWQTGIAPGMRSVQLSQDSHITKTCKQNLSYTHQSFVNRSCFATARHINKTGLIKPLITLFFNWL